MSERSVIDVEELALRLADVAQILSEVTVNEDTGELVEDAGGLLSALDHALRGSSGCLEPAEFEERRRRALVEHRVNLGLAGEDRRDVTPLERRGKSAVEQAMERAGPSRYFVTMTVSTYVEARDKAAAMQMGCDLVHPLVVEGRLGVHTVDAQWAPEYMPPGGTHGE